MPLRFIGIDPNTHDNGCPAVFLGDVSGDLLFQGWTETDPSTLAQAAEHSPLAANETVVRLPVRMREIIKEAVDAASTAV
jgi:hypothetical protein